MPLYTVKNKLDTALMVEGHRHRISLSPINSGCTVPNPQPRGRQTFLPVESYPFDDWLTKRRSSRLAVAELAVEYSVPEIENLVVRVDRMKDGQLLDTIW